MSDVIGSRPHVSVILAMSADGKITDAEGSAARFPSRIDKDHLEVQVAKADATLFGAGTLRAYGTTLSVQNPELIAQRRQRHQPEQPIQIVCSASGQLDAHWRFFQQPIPRWLITSPAGQRQWRSRLTPSQVNQALFDQELVMNLPFDWLTVFHELQALSPGGHLKKLLVMGGGQLVAALLAENLVDDLYLTICPLLIGGQGAPTPVDGLGFRLPLTPQLTLQSSRVEGDEIFLHYRVCGVTASHTSALVESS